MAQTTTPSYGSQSIPPLRDYQQACLQAIVSRYQAGVRRQLIVAPTGSGKTVIAAALPPLLGWPRTLFLVHRKELIQQAYNTFRSFHPSTPVGIEHAATKSDNEPVIIASVPTLARPQRLSRFPYDSFGLIVQDESHHSTASTFRRVLAHFGILDRTHQGLLIGMTATPRRGDGVGLSAIFDEVTYSIGILELVDRNWLVPLRGWLARSETSLAGVRIHHGDFDERELAAAIDIEARNRLVVASYQQIASDRKAIVFAVDIAHAKHLAEAFNSAGIPAAPVWGSMPAEQRAARLKEFHHGRVRVVTNAALLMEGYDHPSVNCIIMARPTCSSLLYTQCIGRGTRIAPGKTDCLVIDVVDASRRHAHQLITLPTLFGLPIQFNLHGVEVRRVMRQYEQAATHFSEVGIPSDIVNLILSPQDVRRLLDEVDLLRFAQVPPHIAEASPFVWQRMPDGRYLSQVSRDHALAVKENVLGRFDVLQMTPDGPIKHAEHATLSEALRWSSRLVFTKWPQAAPRLSRSARWRTDPATEKQIETMRRMRITGWDGITKGQASMLIERKILASKWKE